jgi:hypothetical protein
MHTQLALILISLAIFLTALAVKKITGKPIFPLAFMALSADRDTPTRESKLYSYPVLTGVKIYDGAIVVLDSSGWAKPAITGTGLVAVGRARALADNTLGGSGDIYVEVEEGVFQYDNSAAGDEITKAQIGDICWLVDDCTVAKTSGTNTRSIAGYIRDLDTNGVWVEFKNTLSADGDVVAANNLSDVNAATARANLGANKVVVSVRATDLVAADAVLYGVVSPVAGTIVKIYSVLKGHALAGGDATLTGKIGGTAITTGVITITQAGSAIGDEDNVTPSALNVVAAGDEIQFLVGGANTDTDAFAEISLVIET